MSIYGQDVFRNSRYGGANWAATGMPGASPTTGGSGEAGIFGQSSRRSLGVSGTAPVTPAPPVPPVNVDSPASSNMTTGAPDPTASNMTGGAPNFGASVNRSGPPVGPQYSTTAPPGTPPPAPTSAQVAADPKLYAGTSFDPNLGAQFKPPTGLANSTTANTKDSNGETIMGFQPYRPNPARGADPSTIPGWVQPGTSPNGVDVTAANALGTQRNNQTLIYGPYQGTYGYRWVDNGAIDNGQAFVDAVAPNLREGLQVTPEWIANMRRFYGVR